jgi:hypothetical protein
LGGFYQPNYIHNMGRMAPKNEASRKIISEKTFLLLAMLVR